MSTVNKRETKPRTYTTKDVYKAYAKQMLKDDPTLWGKYDRKMMNYYVYRQDGTTVVEVMSYPRYRKIVEAYFLRAQDYIIQGETLSLGNNLGKIAGRRCERNHKNKQVNWEKTKKLWESKGERKGLVYFTDDDWCRIGWNKPGKIKNEKWYRFTPAEGNSGSDIGFKKAFSTANLQNPLLKLKYKFFAYIKDE